MAILKPCPFCGRKVKLEDNEDSRLSALWKVRGNKGFNRYIIECPRCEGSCGSYLTIGQAIDAWNRRADHEYIEGE